jgi:hypothetical protein
MIEYLIRGDDDEADLGLTDADAREALKPVDRPSELTGDAGWYQLRIGAMTLELSDEAGFGWQVSVEGATHPDDADAIVDVIASQIGARLRRPTRVVRLN